MSNMFLRQRNIEGESSTPLFVRPTTIDTSAITDTYKGTSGNKIVDMALDTATKMATKFEEGKRRNELAELELQSINNVREYEAQWAGLDKYSEENYSKYRAGLDEVYATNKELMSNTKFTTKEDVDKWNITTQKGLSDALYIAEGKKSEYDIKEITNRTILNVDALSNESAYATSEDESNRLLSQGMSLIDNLKPYMSDTEVLKMKSKLLANTTKTRLENQLTDYINSGATLEDKRTVVSQFMTGIKNDSPYKATLDVLKKNGAISSEDVDMLLSYNKQSIEEIANKAGGIKSRLDEQIFNQEYQERQRVESTKAQLQQSYLNEIKGMDSNVRSGNYSIAISNAEGVPYTPTDIMSNPTLTTKYFGNNLNDIVMNGEYVQMYSTTETSRMKQEIEANENAGQSRSQAIQSVMEELSAYNAGVERENVIRGLIAREVIGADDVQLYYSSPEQLNNIYSGRKTREAKNIIYGDILKSTRSDLKAKIDTLSPYQKKLVTEAMLGKINNGEVGWSSQVKFNARNFDNAYKTDKTFRAQMDSIIGDIKDVGEIRLKERKSSRDVFKKVIDEKYESKNVLFKRYPEVEEVKVYRQSYTESIFD